MEMFVPTTGKRYAGISFGAIQGRTMLRQILRFHIFPGSDVYLENIPIIRVISASLIFLLNFRGRVNIRSDIREEVY